MNTLNRGRFSECSGEFLLCPGKLLSLWDMKTYMAKRLADISQHLTMCHFMAFNDDYGDITSKSDVVKRLTAIATEAEAIALPLTSRLAKRLTSEITPQNANDKIGTLEERFNDELENVQFFLVSPDRMTFYDNTEIAGLLFKDKFPKGNGELIEAGNCLVTGRNTACVFHLMRALELALIALERQLGIQRPPSGPECTWGRTLGRISDQIKANDKSPPVDWAVDKPFYQQVHALLSSFKSAYRDPTAHVASTYDEAGANSVFRVVVETLRHVATKLVE